MPIARFSVLTLVWFGFSACSPGSERSRADTSNARAQSTLSAPDSSAVAGAQDTAADKRLTCSPLVLGAGDTLTLRMKIPHPEYLMVDHPDGTPFQIVYPSLGDPGRKYSYVPSEEFKTMATLRIPADIKANPFVLGRENGVEPLFTKSGIYKIHVGEPEGRTDDCNIRYRGKR